MTLSKPANTEDEAFGSEISQPPIQPRKIAGGNGLADLNGAVAHSFESGEDADAVGALSCLLQEDDLRRLDLAQRLHKDVAGGLVACTAVGEMIRQDFAQRGLPSHLTSMLASMDSTLRQTIQVVREMTEAQFPPVLKAFGLCVALQQLVRTLAERFVGALVLHINGDEPVFDPVRRIGVYRILETLLSRCVRSSKTSWVEVTCSGSGGRAEFIMDYDGEESLWAAPEHAIENEIIQARCALLGANFNITDAPTGRCHRLILIVPLLDEGGGL